MGFFGSLLNVATSIIPGPLDDAIVDVGRGILSSRSQPAAPQIGAPMIATPRQQQRFARNARGGRNRGAGRRGRANLVSGGRIGCEPGQIRLGSACIDPPGTGNPGVGIGTVGRQQRQSSAPGQWGVTDGSFNMPAFVPEQEVTTRLKCPPSFVLGKDDLCYPKSYLGRRNANRKWKGTPKPAVSAHDMKVARTADRVAERIKKVSKDLGMATPKKKRR